MNYSEAMEYLKWTLQLGSKPGLQSIGSLLELLGNPQKRLRIIHVGGTNGKGSTIAFISSVLQSAGYRTGVFTSPGIECFEERIKINGIYIGNEDIARLTGRIKDKIALMLERGEDHPTEFEISTAMAFEYFAEKACDFVVLEVGMGGRLDATNIIDTPLVSVLTTISYDHIDYLGSTLEAITAEKAGIIKEGGTVASYPQAYEAERVIYEACEKTRSVLHFADIEGLQPKEMNEYGQIGNFKGYGDMKIALLGEHQLKNAALALKTIEILKDKGFNIDKPAIVKGLAEAEWPARLEILHRNPVFIIDGAHNLQGAAALRKALDDYFPGRRRIFISGVLRDKDYKGMMEAVLPGSSDVFAVEPDSYRALPAVESAKIMRNYCKNVVISGTIEEAIRASLGKASSNDLICAFGSLYFMGRIRSFFKTTQSCQEKLYNNMQKI